VNLILAPVSLLNSARISGARTVWDKYDREAADFNYPYDDFYRWLAGQHCYRQVLISGRARRYADRFYVRKYAIATLSFVNVAAMGPAAEKVSQDSLLLVHLEPGQDLSALAAQYKDFPLQVSFSRGELSLAVFGRRSCEQPEF
jgi:hypothetical protein